MTHVALGGFSELGKDPTTLDHITDIIHILVSGKEVYPGG
jgi:hypothetical protein